MPKETSDPIDYEAMIKAQELKIIGDHSPEDNQSNNQYTVMSEGAKHPTDMYKPALSYYSEERPDWLIIIEINGAPQESEIDRKIEN